MKNKHCPCRKTCRGECYGEQPCDYAKAFDRLGQELDRREVAILSLRDERDALKAALDAVQNENGGAKK